MAEVLVRYTAEVVGKDGTRYVPQACGGIAPDGLWEGWIEFVSGEKAIRTARETEQPSRDAVMYWAQGLTDTYLEGALARATTERTVVPREIAARPRFDRPAPPRSVPLADRARRTILDPFSTFDQGETLLRQQLTALSHDNLVAIVDDYALGIPGASDMQSPRLVDSIVSVVKSRSSFGSPIVDELRHGQRP